MELREGEYLVSDDKSLLQLPVICGFLARSYWANGRPEEATRQAIEHSVCYGLYRGGVQIGFARVVTDGATVYYLCDVYIDEDERGKGLGKMLVGAIVREYERIPGFLGTRDAHGLYEQYGFRRDAERFMRRAP
ncbi:GNAT family N-acetyltransferase [Cohnella zeiphila]|uniref:GNAT family N-acetyltransferase n=1 Tax=Cohnella zeiphila TaxID=2761120 RepID=A0A7X0VX89_9BACL|nr:GNAT family N-acetyltransferase [Cohnella zeiphila]MBB6733776.1 GNAT family N-acetyltransferase [Cohnella zeiphila]